MTGVRLEEVAGVLEPAFALGDPDSGGKPQERANVELLGRLVQAIAAGRFDELRPHVAEDASFEIVAPATLPWVRQAAGADEVVAAIASNFGSVCEQRTEPLALVSQGDTVMVMARETGRMTDSGEPYRAVMAQQFTFRDGRLAVFRSVTQLE